MEFQHPTHVFQQLVLVFQQLVLVFQQLVLVFQQLVLVFHQLVPMFQQLIIDPMAPDYPWSRRLYPRSNFAYHPLLILLVSSHSFLVLIVQVYRLNFL